MKLSKSEEKVITAIRAAANKGKAAKEAYNAALAVVVKEACKEACGEVLNRTQIVEKRYFNKPNK